MADHARSVGRDTQTAGPTDQAKSSSTGHSESFLICGVGTRFCGLPINYVTETMRPLRSEPLGGTPEFIRGVAVIRGEAVPVVDAGLLLGGEEANASRFVSIRFDERTVALAVDAVLGVRAIADDDLRELPPLLEGASGDVIASLGQLDSEMLVVLEGARLVPESVWDMIDGQVSA